MRPTANGKGSYTLIAEKAKKFAESAVRSNTTFGCTFTGYNKDFGNDVLFLADEGWTVRGTWGDDPSCEYAQRKRTCRRSWRSMIVWADLSGSPCERQVVQLLPLHGGLWRVAPACASV